MPKETFFNLNIEKRNKIEKAIEHEFGRTTFEKASISNIIEEAKIPRGSFYQYFEDKEDAISYVVKKYMDIEKQYMKKILKENKGDLFESFLKIFDYMTDKAKREEKIDLYKNIMKEIKKSNITIFEETMPKKEIDEIINLIDCKSLNVKSNKELKYVLQILSTITKSAEIRTNGGKENKEEAKKELMEQFEILKKGIIKK